jgi:hypothetical protein
MRAVATKPAQFFEKTNDEQPQGMLFLTAGAEHDH